MVASQIAALIEERVIDGIATASRDGQVFEPAQHEPELALVLQQLATMPLTLGDVASPNERTATHAAPIPMSNRPAAAAPPVVAPIAPAGPWDPQPLAEMPSAGRIEEHPTFQLYGYLASGERSGLLVLGEGRVGHGDAVGRPGEGGQVTDNLPS